MASERAQSLEQTLCQLLAAMNDEDPTDALQALHDVNVDVPADSQTATDMLHAVRTVMGEAIAQLGQPLAQSMAQLDPDAFKHADLDGLLTP